MEVDYLVVGSGLAGSCLALELIEQNQRVLVVDDQNAPSSSEIAIGLVNPITGKRLVKSWLIDQLLPISRAFYHTYERRAKSQFIYDCTIARVIPNEEIFQQWQSNYLLAIEEGYIAPQGERITLGENSMDVFFIQKAYWLDTTNFLSFAKKTIRDKASFLDERFDFTHFNHLINTYKKVVAKNVIFCEGYKAIDNPFFSYLPFNLNRGEVVKAQLSEYPMQDIVKKNIFIVPMEKYCRIGATYDRDHLELEVTQAALDYFANKLDALFGEKKHYHFFDQEVGIRPATRDRRPFIGRHKEFQNIAIFNGFGAKGVSLIPYFAKQFVQDLINNTSNVLHPEASIHRFD